MICPPGTTQVDTFSAAGLSWLACEDLRLPGGGITLVPERGAAVHLPKSYEPYSPKPDDYYYLGLGKDKVLGARWDMLGDAVINECPTKTSTTRMCEPTWQRVERALPVMRYSFGNKQASGNAFMCSPYSPESGVRTFTGSRSASVDATFSDHADDCTDNGFPRPQGYVMNLTAIAAGEPPIHDFMQYVNFTAMADGLVGGSDGYPNLIFYFPIQKQNFSSFGGSRYWTMIASPVPDMQGSREQSVWFRFQQLRCAGAAFAPPCELLGRPQYYDTYWYSFSPITSRWIRPELQANASGFYSNLLAVKGFWDAELAAEGMMSLSLPATATTNGTWLAQQARFSFVRSMISRDDTWHPRYGVLPGYGVTLQDGFQDVFTSTATAALEWGSVPYARGVIDNWLRYYVRDNGMITYRAEELAQSGRMLTIFALYFSTTGDAALLLEHWPKIHTHASWLLYRWKMAMDNYPDANDARHGIVAGGDEGDTFTYFYETHGKAQPLGHKYSCHSNVLRGFEDLGRVWHTIGSAMAPGVVERSAVLAHAKELLNAVPQMRAQLQASLNKTTIATHNNPRAPRCVPTGADARPWGGGGAPLVPWGCYGDFRGYPELMYSGELTYQQADDVYTQLMYGNASALGARPTTLSVTGYDRVTWPPAPLDHGASWMATYVAFGMGYGLLVHDMVERFLLHYFAMSAHTYTRGSWTTPEGTIPDRDRGSTDYVAAGVVIAPTYLKWMLLFEEPNTRTVWLAKALPREWLGADAGAPVKVSGAPTRYGRVSFALSAKGGSGGVAGSGGVEEKGGGGATLTIVANVTLPATFVGGTGPLGGLRLRLRAPMPFAGKMTGVTVDGKAWADFDAQAETVNFATDQITSELLAKGLPNVVAQFRA